MNINMFAVFAVAIGDLIVYAVVHFVHDEAEEHTGVVWGLVALVTAALAFGLHFGLTHGVSETVTHLSQHSSH
jgi:hypothetical protein